MEPNFVPLEKTMLHRFMYMGKDATGQIHLYKHSDTRRYINISEEGRFYRFQTTGYVQISQLEAITHVFS